MQEPRARWRIKIDVEPPLDVAPVPVLKLDVGPPCWLEPVVLPFRPQPIHDRYGGVLPPLPMMRLDEVLARRSPG